MKLFLNFSFFKKIEKRSIAIMKGKTNKTKKLKLVSIVLFLLMKNVTYAQVSHSSYHHAVEDYFRTHTKNVMYQQSNFDEQDYQNGNLMYTADSLYKSYSQFVKNHLKNENIDTLLFNQKFNEIIAEIRFLNGNEKKKKPKNPDAPKVLNGPCVNMDFEQGNTSGWNCIGGSVSSFPNAPYSFNSVGIIAPGSSHVIVGGGNDAVTGIPRVFPGGGTKSLMLGDATGTGNGAARIEQAFLVDSTNYAFQYSYAVIFQDPAGHPTNDKPYFTVRIFNSAGQSIPCGAYNVIAGNNSSGYQSTTDGFGETVLYKNWTTVIANLSQYIGQNVTIQFTVGDCAQGGHYGYAYIDASCAKGQITATSNTICPGGSAVLTAPSGATSYQWSAGNPSNTQSITVTQAGTYTCTLTTVAGAGCNVTLPYKLVVANAPTASFTANTVCFQNTTNFSSTASVASPNTIQKYKWNFGDGTSTPLSNGTISGVANTNGTYSSPNHYYTAAGNYSVTLTVETDAGCQFSVTNQITVNPKPTLVISPDITLCQGGDVTITASGAPTLSWSPYITSGVAFTPNLGQTQYTVIGTNAFGCMDTADVTVTVNPLPNIVASPDVAICIGANTNISATGGVNYTWTGLGSSNPLNVTPNATTTYTVTGTDANGCQNTDQVTITVNPLPSIVASPDVAICIGANTNISASGGITYVWNNGLPNGPSHMVTPSSTTTYSVTGTDANGCINSDQVTITVNPLPTIVASPDVALCSGANTTISAQGGVTYSWDNALSAGASFLVAPPITTTYTVVGTDANGCVNTDQVLVTINPNPIVTASPDVTICIDDTASISVSSNGTGMNYQWSQGLGSGTTHYISPSDTTTYNVIGTDINGCVGNDVVVVNVLPFLPVSAGQDIEICENETVLLSGSGADTYVWNNGVTNLQPFTPSVGTHTYTVIGYSNFGCFNTDSVVVIVHPKPTIQFVASKYKGCIGDVITFTNNTQNAVSCFWSISNGASSNDCTPFSVTFDAEGFYDVSLTVTDNFGCTNTKTVNQMIEIIADPIADFNASSYSVLNINTLIEFENLSLHANSYWWDFGDGTANSTMINPSHEFPDIESQKYVVTLVAYNALGCPDTIQKIIEVVEDIIFYVPNTFTPDDDEYNQTFQPIFTSGYDPFDFTMLIFNRWGEIIFETHDDKIGWDGTYNGNICQDGTYTWKIEFKTKKNDERKFVVGHVNIIR